MKKAELLADLLSKEWVDDVCIGPEPVEKVIEAKPNEDKWYSINIREVVGRAAIYRNIHFYVIDEGTVNERAYYKDREPEPSIKPPQEPTTV